MTDSLKELWWLAASKLSFTQWGRFYARMRAISYRNRRDGSLDRLQAMYATYQAYLNPPYRPSP